MNMPHNIPKFNLVEIDPFDARRGYKRCTLPGVGYTPPDDPLSPYRSISCAADFWRDKSGELVVRFSSNQPYVFHFKGVLSNGKPIPEEAIHEFGEYIAAILSDWGGADDPPNPEFGFETQS